MSVSQTAADDEDDTPPANDTELYRATEGRHAGRGDFLWFVSHDGTRDEMLPLSDIRRIEPPRTATRQTVYIHFSGITVILYGEDLRRILQRLNMRRCAAIYELRPGQRRPPKGEPVVERIVFKDMARQRRPEPDGGARH